MGNLGSGILMRALVICGAGRYALFDHDVAAAGPGDLLLAPLAVELCATDLEAGRLDVYLREGRGHLPLATERAALPAERVLGPVSIEIAEAIAADRAAAIKAWQAAWSDERYRLIMATLTRWLVEVPVQSSALTGPAVLQKARRQARRRLNGASDDPAELHRARKATKRLRYAGELLTQHVPQAEKSANKAKKMQTVLGEHKTWLLPQTSYPAPEPRRGPARTNGYTYGLLTARVEEEAARIRARL